MTDLSEFGGGQLPEKRDEKVAHDTRGDRAEHRRRTYRLGRCRAISTAKGCRCGGAVVEDADGDLCHYHDQAQQPPTIDSHPSLVARWCGTRPTTWDEIPEPCRSALVAVAGEPTDGTRPERETPVLHRCDGTGGETQTYCPSFGEWVGPHPDASFNVVYCPYCGDSVTDDDHRVDREVGEVFCEHTGQSTWRYCPRCGVTVDE